MTNTAYHLSVITPTLDRPKLLTHCLRQFRQQVYQGIEVEHIIVADGPGNAMANWITSITAYKSRYIEAPEFTGSYGGRARDIGIEVSLGDYICFFDDDNLFEPHALASLYATAHGFDVGICQVKIIDFDNCGEALIPEAHRNFEPRIGFIDGMCLCVRREVAIRFPWYLPQEHNIQHDDFNWVKRMWEAGVSFNFVPIIIGAHLQCRTVKG